MLNENAKLWVEDLRKNGNLQGRNKLHQVDKALGDRFCCLGRACVLYNKNNPNNQLHTYSSYSGDFVLYENNAIFLPSKVISWLGLSSAKGYFRKNDIVNSLVTLNDSSYTFAEIADIIESEPEGLFV